MGASLPRNRVQNRETTRKPAVVGGPPKKDTLVPEAKPRGDGNWCVPSFSPLPGKVHQKASNELAQELRRVQKESEQKRAAMAEDDNSLN